MDYAKRGMVEALKARNPVYRLLLVYFLWMQRLSGRARWVVVLGFYFGYQLLRGAAAANPALQPYVAPILVAYLIFVVLTWVAQPMFNLLLRSTPMAAMRYRIHQVVASNWFGGFLAAAVVLGLDRPFKEVSSRHKRSRHLVRFHAGARRHVNAAAKKSKRRMARCGCRRTRRYRLVHHPNGFHQPDGKSNTVGSYSRLAGYFFPGL